METEKEVNVWGSKGVRKKRQVVEASEEMKRNNKRSKNMTKKEGIEMEDSNDIESRRDCDGYR
ncbi:unnamed protein product [Eruca vesicaria subsp. sativa]|uniref:Uncharacterized protein n=1 Tax=Eruca vesicaria subsp. sativa TaxID=29727 RepID=A0ABC8LHW6_ERUVS|nr:unnamed protein product [Eruca vesicaria subsp. sativa]